MRSFSIIITNYNYGRYLSAAIESALNQTVSPTEVIVVDDGSTDDSRSIIASYGTRVHPVFQENRGQRAAYNAGFQASSGNLVLFLDADDLLDSPAVEQVLAHANERTAKVHFPLRIIDREGRETGGTVPSEQLQSGNFSERLLRHGYYSSPPSSGNVYARSVLERILPMDEGPRYNADTYTGYLAPLFGEVVAVKQPLGSYRLHGSNHDLAGLTSEATLKDALARDIERIAFLQATAEKQGLAFNHDCLRADVHHLKLRISLLRLAPTLHMFRDDSRLLLLFLGLKATWSTGYLSLKRKLLFIGWFISLAFAPNSFVPRLASIGCSPAARASSMAWLLSTTKQ